MKRSILQRIAAGIAERAAKYAGIPLRDPALVALLGRQPSNSGVDVDESSAMTLSAVWQAVNLIAGSVASLPVSIYKRVGEGHEEDREHNLSHKLGIAPNPEMTPFVYHETLQAHALTWGNAYAKIEWSGRQVEALWPLMPNQIEPDRDLNGDLVYKFTAMYENERDEIIPARDIVHVPGLGFDGLRGYAPIQLARESIGLGLATEQFGASFFGRGSIPGGVLEVPLELSPEARKNLRESWELLHRGPDNAHRIALLEEGTQYKMIGIPPEDAQFLQTRQFQVIEIARWFNVPPHMLRDLVNATFSNIEHQGIDFLMYTLRPWLIRWVQEYARKLLSPTEQRVYSFGHKTHELLQTDTLARYNSYAIGRSNGWLTLNDILQRERMRPVEGPEGQVRLMPQNMTVFGPHLLPNEDGSTDPKAAQDSVLSGQQINALVALNVALQAGTINPEAAKHLIRLSFPKADPSQVDAMVKPYARNTNAA